MTRLAFLAAAATLAVTVAAPAQADTGRTAIRAHAASAVLLNDNACARDLAAASCSTYQSKLLAAAARDADPRHAATMRAVGRQQLDALIASIN